MLPTCYESTLQLYLSLSVRCPPYRSAYKKQTNAKHAGCLVQETQPKAFPNTHPITNASNLASKPVKAACKKPLTIAECLLINSTRDDRQP